MQMVIFTLISARQAGKSVVCKKLSRRRGRAVWFLAAHFRVVEVHFGKHFGRLPLIAHQL